MITVIQMCDACGGEREIRPSAADPDLSKMDISREARTDGWREVRKNRHLCGQCITDMIMAGTTS